MRKILLLPLLLSTLMACSVDNDELMQEDEFAALNAQAEGCTTNAGEDNLAVYTNPEIDELVDDFGQVRGLYLDLLDQGVVRDGTFNPSLRQVFHAYKRNTYGDFTTTYTVVEGQCTDSTDLTITICEEIFDAGSPNSVTYTTAEIDAQISDVGQIDDIYLGLLDEGVDRSGTLNLSGQKIYDNYKDNGPGAYSNTYTLGEGNCGDSVELTINIVE